MKDHDLLRLAQVFVAEKHFEGCAGLAVTEEMKMTIAAEACLLLLHLDGPCYPTLRTVLIYPHAFIAKHVLRGQTGIAQEAIPLRGESWRDGVVVISWDDVVCGARDAADGSNVVRLTRLSGTDAHPAWSPDGASIVYARRQTAIVMMDAGGSNKNRIYADASAIISNPDWQPTS